MDIGRSCGLCIDARMGIRADFIQPDLGKLRTEAEHGWTADHLKVPVPYKAQMLQVLRGKFAAQAELGRMIEHGFYKTPDRAVEAEAVAQTVDGIALYAHAHHHAWNFQLLYIRRVMNSSCPI